MCMKKFDAEETVFFFFVFFLVKLTGFLTKPFSYDCTWYIIVDSAFFV